MYISLVCTLALVLACGWVGEGKDGKVTPTYPSLYKTTWPSSEKPRPDPAPGAKEDVFISTEDEDRIDLNQEEVEIQAETDGDGEVAMEEDEKDGMEEGSKQEGGEREEQYVRKGGAGAGDEDQEEAKDEEDEPEPLPEGAAPLYRKRVMFREEMKFDNNLDQLDFCPKRASRMTLKVYCRHLANGVYYDPWNPYCGYINCTDWLATRVCCNDGSWLGTKDELLPGMEFICRKKLPEIIPDVGECPYVTDHKLCQEAKRVELMNPVHLAKSRF